MRPGQEGKSTKQERRPSLAATGAFDPCDHEQARGCAATPDRGRRPYWRVWRADGESKKAGTITGVFVLYVHWRILILLIIIFIFLISQYTYHSGRHSRPSFSIPQSSRTSLILPAKCTTAASVLLYPPRYSRRLILIRRRYHKH
jgi:hypothetical protein